MSQDLRETAITLAGARRDNEVPMDVLNAAWIAAGRPCAVAPRYAGACARCGRAGPLAAVADVVSRAFTGWDGWVEPSGPGLCRACAWAYRTPRFRAGPAHVTARPPAIAHLSAARAAAVLCRPLAPDTALVVPLRPGRKHLLPGASWGRVTVEDAQLTWSRGDVARLQAMLRLRRDGFGSRMLAAPAPPFPVLRRLARARWAAAIADWEALGPWRRRRPWFDLAVHLTTPAAAGEPMTRAAALAAGGAPPPGRPGAAGERSCLGGAR